MGAAGGTSIRATRERWRMRLKLACRMSYQLQQPTPMIALLNVHFSRFGDLERPDHLVTNPGVPLATYRDSFGNWCTRLVAPAGEFTIGTDTVVRDSGAPDPFVPEAARCRWRRCRARCCGR